MRYSGQNVKKNIFKCHAYLMSGTQAVASNFTQRDFI